jgi:hypothetical protein
MELKQQREEAEDEIEENIEMESNSMYSSVRRDREEPEAKAREPQLNIQ